LARIERFEDLEAWRKARELTGVIYRVTTEGSFARDFGLRDQIRRASVSVLSNIAEGFERGGDKEFFQFLALAKGSCGEVRAQLYVALDQGYLTQEQFDIIRQMAFEVSRMISGLMKYLRQSDLRGRKYREPD
jgi:four helix bundle protein